jgi:hypothetical protein
VRGVSRAAAIAANKQLISSAQAMLDQIGSLCHLCVKIREGLQRFYRGSNRVLENLR